MLIDVKVPILAESVAEATLLDWQKQAGEPVNRGELLLELETDKVVLEVTAPETGLLKDLHRKKGDTVQSDEVIATIDTDYAAQEKVAQTEAPQVMSKAEARREGIAPEEPPASPSIRRMLTEQGLQPEDIQGSGKNGRIQRSDVSAHLERLERPATPDRTQEDAAREVTGTEPSPIPAAGDKRGERREPLSRLRARVAERLVEAQQTAAILTTFNEVNMAPVMALRARYREAFEKKHRVRLGYMSFFTRASLLALQRFPKVNAYLDGKEVVYHDYHDVGIAVGSERGLVVPVLRNVEHMSFAAIESAIAGFAEKTRNGKLSPEDLAGGTFTITNGGIFGSLLSTPILNPPQTAILGMHKIEDRPVAEEGQVVIRPMMYLALSYDHRLIDGREAVQFLVTVKEALEDPARILLEV